MSELEDQLRQQIRKLEIDLEVAEASVELLKRELDMIGSRVTLTDKVLSAVRTSLMIDQVK